jgi:hypothetical protein
MFIALNGTLARAARAPLRQRVFTPASTFKVHTLHTTLQIRTAGKHKLTSMSCAVPQHGAASTKGLWPTRR